MTKRLHHLDVLRGVAMLGILPVNIAFFALPSGKAALPAPEAPLADVLVDRAILGLFTYKFVTLFSLLFGMGMMLMWQRSNERGDGYAGLMLRRLFALWALGLLHATLLWQGDVVSVYAPLGLLLCWTAALRAKTLQWLGVALLCVPLLCCACLAAIPDVFEGDGEVVSTALEPEAPWPEYVRACVEAVEGDHPDFETAVFRDGSFARTIVLRLALWLFYGVAALVYFGWRLAGLFLIGMAWIKAGWFADPEGRPGAFRRLLVLGLAFGLPLQVAAVVVRGEADWTAETHVHELLQYLGSLGMAAAYAAAVCLLVARFGAHGRLAPFAAVGRTAFSNYVLQSVLCGVLFYSYAGFGLYGRFALSELLGVVVAIWIVETALSVWWVQRFRWGPIEWIWRCVTYWRVLPLGRDALPRDNGA
jgi:uncharacterized protein